MQSKPLVVMSIRHVCSVSRHILRIQGCLTQTYFLFVSQYDGFRGGPKEPIEERAGMDLSWAHLSGLNRAESTRVKTTARCGCSRTLFHLALLCCTMTCEAKQNK